jgi:hypothetical protein
VEKSSNSARDLSVNNQAKTKKAVDKHNARGGNNEAWWGFSSRPRSGSYRRFSGVGLSFKRWYTAGLSPGSGRPGHVFMLVGHISADLGVACGEKTYALEMCAGGVWRPRRPSGRRGHGGKPSECRATTRQRKSKNCLIASRTLSFGLFAFAADRPSASPCLALPYG